VAITVELPAALRPYASGERLVHLESPCPTLRDVLMAISERCPGVVDRVLDERGRIRQHVNVFVDEESVRFLGELEAPVSDQSSVFIVPAVSGG
jgi:molybdopterin synthase sulfur carrier subunit